MTSGQIAYAIDRYWEPRCESLEAFIGRCFPREPQETVAGALGICADRLSAAEIEAEEAA